MGIEEADNYKVGAGCLVRAGETFAAFAGGFIADGITNGLIEPGLFNKALRLTNENSPDAVKAAENWAKWYLPDINPSSHTPNLILGSGLLALYAACKLLEKDKPGKHFSKFELALRGFWNIAAGASIFLSPQIVQKAIETPKRVTDLQWAMLGIAAFEVGKGIVNYIKFREGRKGPSSHFRQNPGSRSTDLKEPVGKFFGGGDNSNTKSFGLPSERETAKECIGRLKEEIEERTGKGESNSEAIRQTSEHFELTGHSQFNTSAFDRQGNEIITEVDNWLNEMYDNAILNNLLRAGEAFDKIKS